jgi:outer membrane lipoprotein-sorting protein
MFFSAIILPLTAIQTIDADVVASRYISLLQNSNTASGVFNVTVTGAMAGQGDVTFAINRDGQFRLTTLVNEELFDGKLKYSRDFNKLTYKVYDSRAAGFPLLTAFEPIVRSKSVDLRDPLFSGKGSPISTSFDGTPAVEMAYGTQRRYINPATALPSGYTDAVNGVQYRAVFKQVNLDAQLGQNTFSFNPRPGERQVPVITEGLIAAGQTLNLASSNDLSNRVGGSILTVLVFVRPSNAASADAMSGLADLARKSRPKLNVIAVSSDNKTAAQYFRNRRTPVPTIEDAQLTRAAGVTQFPTMLILDRNAKVIHAEACGLEGTVRSVLQSNGYTF